MQLPGGASVERTANVIQQAEMILKEEHAVADVTSVIGLNFIDSYSQPNAGFMVVTLKPFEDRKDSASGAAAIMASLAGKFRQIQGGTVVPLPPPPIIGLGTGGGFTYVLQDLSGGDPKALAQVVRGLVVAANQNSELARVFTTFSATNPSIFLDIDRDKVQILGVPLNSVFQALQASLGSYYVNDMNLFGRTWQVQVQAEATDRATIDDMYRINVRSNAGKMIQLRSLVDARIVVGPPALIRYNNLRAVTIQGSPAPGISGAALAAMDAVAVKTLPAGYGGAWTDTAFQEKRAEGKTAMILGFAILFAYLFLVGRLRELDHPGAGAAVGHDRYRWRVRSDPDRRTDPRSLRPDRHGGPDRPRSEERHPDRGVRQGAARKRRSAAGGRDRRRAAALPPGDDDVVRLHPRPVPAGDRRRRLAARAAPCRHARVRRHDLRVVHRDFRDPAALRVLQAIRERLRPAARPRVAAPASGPAE